MGCVALRAMTFGFWCWAVLSFVPVADAAPLETLGSFTFNWTGAAPDNTEIQLAASFVPFGGAGPTNFFNMRVDGLTGAAAASNFLIAIKNRGINAALNPAQPNSINVFSVGNTPISKVAQKNTMAGYKAALDGNVQIASLLPNPRWDVSFDPSTVATAGGNIAFTVPGFGSLSTFLASDSTAQDATLALFDLLKGAGFPDAQCLDNNGKPESGCINSTEVTFFLNPADSPITSVTVLSFDGAGLDYALELPNQIPEPTSLTI